METFKLSTSNLAKFRPSKAFSKSKTRAAITSIDFDQTGEFLVTAAHDETIQLYNCKDGTHSKTLYSKKYGVHLARFTHKDNCIVYASTKEDDTLRYLSLHDNTYVRYFKGHKKRVNSLEQSPLDDQLISTSMDNTVRLWDLRSPACQGMLAINSPSFASFDPTGQIFTVASQPLNSILLYDLRNFDKEPFDTFTIQDDTFLQKYSYPPRMPEWTKVEFSNDGKYILVATKGEVHYVLDAFSGEIKHRLTGHVPTNCKHDTSGNVCFTPDGEHVVGGSGDKSLMIWDMSHGSRDRTLTASHIIQTSQLEVPNVVSFNPRTALLATADVDLFMWLPDASA